MRCYRFHAFDTWFFRESRPHGSAGSQELASLFPPPASTLLGALRTLAGDRAGVDWQGYAHSPQAQPMRARIGVGEDLGELDVAACLLAVGQRPLFPAPYTLLRREKNAFAQLVPGPALACDLGPRVRLPVLKSAGPARPLGQAWIGAGTLGELLAGSLPQPDTEIWTAIADDERPALAQAEPRLGIARDAARGTVEEGMLYQTRHIRPTEPDLNVALYLSGAQDLLPDRATVRLGGEGRMAAVSVEGTDAVPLPSVPRVAEQQRCFALYLLSAARFLDSAGTPTWLLPGFAPDTGADFTCWCGELGGARLRLHCAVLGKPMRVGGWDLARQRPKPLVSYVPAGSVYFLSVDDGTPLAAVFERLHGARLGLQTRAGHGLVACGTWTDIDSVHQQGMPS